LRNRTHGKKNPPLKTMSTGSMQRTCVACEEFMYRDLPASDVITTLNRSSHECERCGILLSGLHLKIPGLRDGSVNYTDEVIRVSGFGSNFGNWSLVILGNKSGDSKLSRLYHLQYYTPSETPAWFCCLLGTLGLTSQQIIMPTLLEQTFLHISGERYIQIREAKSV